MFGLGVTIEFKEFKEHFMKPKAVLIGLSSHFFIMPLVGYLLGLTPAMRSNLGYVVGLIVMCCAPSGSLSNVICAIFRADLNLSVALTTASSIVGMAMMPLNIYIYLAVTNVAPEVCISVGGIIISAGVVAAGTLSGICITPYLTFKQMGFCAMIGVSAAVGILLIGFIANLVSPVPIWLTPVPVIAISGVPVLIGAAFGFIVSRLFNVCKAQSVAVGLETGIQNKFVAIAVLSILFTDPVSRAAAFVVPLFYAIWATLFSFIWAGIAWKCGYTNLDKNAYLWDAIKEYVKDLKAKKAAQEAARAEKNGNVISSVTSAASNPGFGGSNASQKA